VAAAATVAAALLTTQASQGAPAVFLGYVVCLCACAVWWLLAGTGAQPDRGVDLMAALAGGPEAPAASPVQRVAELERLVATGIGSAVDAEARLRPELRNLARALLAARHGVEISDHDDVALHAGMAGEPLLEAGRQARLDPAQPGPSAAEVRRVLDHLEII
jgi:hypothetical protein